jgi:hypothetical protein
MAHSVTRPVWQDVEINLELALEFDPEHLGRAYPGLVPFLAELLIGPPRVARTLTELEPFAGLRSLEAKHAQLRLDFQGLKRLGLTMDALFAALEFDVIGKPVKPVRYIGITPGSWRSTSSIWACHKPLRDAA